MDEKEFLLRWQQTVEPGYGRLFGDLAGVARSMDVAYYIVGGFLRDKIIGKSRDEHVDLDIIIEGDAISFVRALQNKYGGEVRIHKRFGTANWLIDKIKSRWISNKVEFPDSLDLISARKEGYRYAGALPTVMQGNISDDIDRRDFTINTLAIRLDTPEPIIIDRHNALNDIQQGVIRILHDNSFVDDPTRIFRAVRYEQRYGFSFDPLTFGLLRSGLEYVNRISGDRIRHEINHILEEENIILILKRLDELGVLAQIHGDFSFRDTQINRIVNLLDEFKSDISSSGVDHKQKKQRMIYAAWLSSFDREICQAIAARLNLPQSIIRVLDGYYKIYERRDFIRASEPIDITEFLDIIPSQSVHLAAIFEDDFVLKEIFIQYLREWKDIRPELNGDDLLERKISPGPQYTTILRRLRAAKLNGIIHSRQEEYRFLEKLLVELYRNGT